MTVSIAPRLKNQAPTSRLKRRNCAWDEPTREVRVHPPSGRRLWVTLYSSTIVGVTTRFISELCGWPAFRLAFCFTYTCLLAQCHASLAPSCRRPVHRAKSVSLFGEMMKPLKPRTGQGCCLHKVTCFKAVGGFDSCERSQEHEWRKSCLHV
jgi:hypothetical protein